jgi:hypothetical protein
VCCWGYFGGPGQWKKFGDAWKEIIQRYNVREFHARDFWRFDQHRERVGPYRGWSKEKADAFLYELVGVITRHRRKIHPISATVVVACFNKLSHNQRRFLTGGFLKDGKFGSSGAPTKPYFLPFQVCIVQSATNAPVGGKAHFAFDLNKQFKGHALQLFALVRQSELKVQDRIGEVTFPTGLEAVQLQAADLLCYRSYRHAQRKVRDPEIQVPHLLRQLLSGLLSLSDFPFFDDRGLAALLEGVDVPND